MGNKGAFITMGMDMKPNYTTYDAVVSFIIFYQISKNVISDGWVTRNELIRNYYSDGSIERF